MQTLHHTDLAVRHSLACPSIARELVLIESADEWRIAANDFSLAFSRNDLISRRKGGTLRIRHKLVDITKNIMMTTNQADA